MNFESRIKFESKAVPGVTVKLNKMTEGRRIKLRLQLAEYFAEMRDLMDQIAALKAEAQSNPEAQTEIKASDLSFRVDTIIREKIRPGKFKWGVHSVDGLTIDGVPATIDSLLEDGPAELYIEIIDEIDRVARLGAKQEGESEPLTTSGAQVVGGMNVSSAETVSAKDSTPAVIAASTSLSS